MKDIIASIDRLSRFEPDGRRVLSVYLATDPSRGPGRNLKAQLNDVFQRLRESVNMERDSLDGEIERVRSYVDNLPERPRGMALFASRALDLYDVLPLPVAPEPGAHWARRINLRPLLSLLDEYEPTLILLVDKERARLFRWVLDAVDEIAGFEDEVPGKHAQGGESQANFQRHHEEHVLQHVRRSVDLLTRRVDADRIRRVALAGPAEVLGHVRRQLPPAIAANVVGTLGVPVAAPVADVLQAVRDVREQWQRDAEIELVSNLEEQRGRGRAVMGVSNVVDAVREHRVRTLVYSVGTTVPGGRCLGCDLLFAEPAVSECPACGSAVQSVDDMLDLLASRVLRAGGTIDEVRGEAAGTLRQWDGIAAALLYPSPTESASAVSG